jgi:OOP family OmpA-OmpF porin
MKRITIITLLTFIAFSAYSQEKETIDAIKDSADTKFNKLTIEFSAGSSKGLKPYTSGYTANSTSINSINVGARYMLSPLFGFRADIGYANLDIINNTTSDKYKMEISSMGIQGVVNGSRLFDLEKSIGKFGLLLHGGFQYSINSPKGNLYDTNGILHRIEDKERNISFIIGFSPQYRLSNKFALISDVSILNSLKQHYAWDGANTDNKNLSGQLFSMSIGVTYSLGNASIHGDWSK